MYKAILLAADGSDNSFRAAEETLNFITEETEVTILNVINAEDSKDDVLHSGPAGSIMDKRKEKLSKIIDLYETNHIPYQVHFEHGTPNETVVNFANNGLYQAVVLGTRGLNGLQEMVLGSVSHKVAKRAEIPVMIVK
ncbi:universal stress protein [Salinicoccus halodurans]|uniref:Universal stress protein n=1 Tax=Salinicoccus halodurans TaxID=407035 RepID=A0A0F7HL45_9STAP|nr:universal stress protein [Salinicoccus halodurans]AKG74639.1 universal stress protein [Salinicoccus halodurans]SFK88967.1 Nucleotide-binding universal stress protein, UspA family [Salinicoccus halodurans]